MRIADVLINIPVYKNYAYITDDEDIVLRRVKIPFGSRSTQGFVSGVRDFQKASYKYKKIYEVLDKKNFISREHFNFLVKVSDNFLLPRGKVLFLSLPPFYDFEKEIFFYRGEGQKGNIFLNIGEFDFPGIISEAEKDVSEGKDVRFVFSDYFTQEQFLETVSKISNLSFLKFGDSKKSGKVWESFFRGEGNVVSGILYPLFLPKRRETVIYLIDEGPQKFYLDHPFPIDLKELSFFSYREQNYSLKIFSISPSLKTYNFVRKEMGKIKSNELSKKRILIAPIKRNTLTKELKAKVKEKENKVLFLINRNAKKRFLYCPKCRTVSTCPDDGATLLFNEETQKVFCPVCKKEFDYPYKCQICGTKVAIIGGVGISSLERTLRKSFENSSFAKYSRKEVSKSKKEKALIDSFLKGEKDFLLGTEISIKPFTIKNLNLIIYFFPELDLGTENPELTEKIFYNLSALSSMLSSEGELIIKSKIPDFYAIEEFLKGDYKSFIEKESKIRKDLKYFPFSNFIIIGVSSKTKDFSLKRIKKYRKILKGNIEEIYGPFYKKKPDGENIFYLVLKGKELDPLKDIIIEKIFPVSDTSTSFFINRFI